MVPYISGKAILLEKLLYCRWKKSNLLSVPSRLLCPQTLHALMVLPSHCSLINWPSGLIFHSTILQTDGLPCIFPDALPWRIQITRGPLCSNYVPGLYCVKKHFKLLQKTLVYLILSHCLVALKCLRTEIYCRMLKIGRKFRVLSTSRFELH